MEIPVVIGIAAAVAVVFMILGFFIGSFVRMKTSEKEIGSASQEATRIINNALTEAEAAKKQALLKLKTKFTSFVQTQTKKYAKDEAKFKDRKPALHRERNTLIKRQIPLK